MFLLIWFLFLGFFLFFLCFVLFGGRFLLEIGPFIQKTLGISHTSYSSLLTSRIKRTYFLVVHRENLPTEVWERPHIVSLLVSHSYACLYVAFKNLGEEKIKIKNIGYSYQFTIQAASSPYKHIFEALYFSMYGSF